MHCIISAQLISPLYCKNTTDFDNKKYNTNNTKLHYQHKNLNWTLVFGLSSFCFNHNFLLFSMNILSPVCTWVNDLTFSALMGKKSFSSSELWSVRCAHSLLHEGFPWRHHSRMMPICRHGYRGNRCHASGPPGLLLKQFAASQEYNCPSSLYLSLFTFSHSLTHSISAFVVLCEFFQAFSQTNTNSPTQVTDTETRMHCDELSKTNHPDKCRLKNTYCT